MGFRYQRRVNLGRGIGLNVSKSGISPSVRTRWGSLGSKGFSLRTGIPGLTWRQGFGRRSGGAGLIVGLILLAIALLPFLLQLAVVIVRVLFVVVFWLVQILFIAPFNLLCWLVQSLADRIAARMSGASGPNVFAVVPAPQPQPQPLTDRRAFQVAGTILLATVVMATYGLINMPASVRRHYTAQLMGTSEDSSSAQADTGQRRTTPSRHPRRKSHAIRPPTPELAQSTAAVAEPEPEPEAAQPVAQPEAPSATETPNDVLASVTAKDPQAAAQIQTFCANATVGSNDAAVWTQNCEKREAAAWTRMVVDNEFPQLDPAMATKCGQPPFPSNSYVAKEACVKYELRMDVPAGQGSPPSH